jgi:hypothetical protein
MSTVSKMRKISLPIGVAQRRHHMRGFAVVECIEAAAQRLSVDGDRGQPFLGGRLRQARGMASKGRLQGGRIDPLENPSQPGVGRRVGQLHAEGVVQSKAMRANELVHLPIGVGAGDHGEDRVEQHGRKIEPLAFPATMIRNLPQNLQQRNLHATTSDSGCRL